MGLFIMKVRDIPKFNLWLKAMIALDSRLGVNDFNALFNLWKRSK